MYHPPKPSLATAYTLVILALLATEHCGDGTTENTKSQNIIGFTIYHLSMLILT